MRFHLDENADEAIALGLRLRGIDVTVTDVAMKEIPDESQVEYGLRTGRVIVTSDKDFLRLHSAGVRHAGIIFYRQRDCRVGRIVAFVELVSECMSDDEMRGTLEHVPTDR